MLVQKGVEYSLKQFFTFNVSVSAPQLGSSAPYGEVLWRFRDTNREYLASQQSSGKLRLETVNGIQQVVILFSMGFLFLVLVSPPLFNRLGFELKWTLLIVIIHNILNCVICSNLSTVHPRFQNRLAWLLPMLVIIIVIKYRDQWRRALVSKPGFEN